MSKVLFEPGDTVPVLELVRAERVLPGEILWGWQVEDNLRKGFHLEAEGIVMEKGALPVDGHPGMVKLASLTAFKADRMVLVQKHVPGAGARERRAFRQALSQVAEEVRGKDLPTA